ncbi:hypothetical protein TIFTF001_016465 [Ficus carica]|uniref:Uncharacterized protein n=1 Tax=Ficus carica TaxID=3494 RepID=A0AA88AAK3_FICCA|nr:hypothetical protein TIFTF001_016465 [Ficus carica]
MPETVSAATPNVIGRSSRARVLGETRSGQLPRAPDGRLEPRSRWVIPVADGYRDKAGVSYDERWRVGSEDLCRYGIYCSDSGARSTASSERMAYSGENGERGRPRILFSADVRLFGQFPRKRGIFTLPSVVGNGILWSEQISIST